MISDSTDDDPIGLLPSPIPLRRLPSPLFSTEEYRLAPLALLDDRSYTAFTLRHMPQRPGLILTLATRATTRSTPGPRPSVPKPSSTPDRTRPGCTCACTKRPTAATPAGRTS
ncbi:hypothetical protein [Streptomyces sp. NPDC018947]|uniref:hypothetical protein n=1 Tax=Streptomyces sp. NPDC018947 TaxID=3365054 RepID=UPI0037AA0D26